MKKCKGNTARLKSLLLAMAFMIVQYTVFMPVASAATVQYAQYTGVDYHNQGLSEARVRALDKAWEMCRIVWTAIEDFPTWRAKDGGYNSVTAIDGSVSYNTFSKGKTYQGIPYRLGDAEDCFDDVVWANYVRDNRITANNMKGSYYSNKSDTTAHGIDCSCFVYKALLAADAGYIYYMNTTDMMNSTSYYRKLSGLSEMIPGDVFIKQGHTMMYVGRNGSKYAVFEATALGSKTRYYDEYTASDLSIYDCYRFRGFESDTEECNCSASYAGYYTCATDSLPLRSGHSTSTASRGQIPRGACVYVEKSNGIWAHVIYNGKSGFASMEDLQRNRNSVLTLPTSRTYNDDVYSIRTTCSTGYSLGVDNDSNANGANIQLWQYDEDNDYEHWQFTYLGSGLYSIRNVGSGRFLDVSEYGQGMDVVQYDDNGPTNNEKWYAVISDEGTFLVPYCNTSTALDINNGIIANGTNVQIWAQNLSNAQRVSLIRRNSRSSKLSLPSSRTYNDGIYSIRMAHNTSYCLGVDNDSNANGANIQLWQYNEDNDYEHWQFTYLGNGLYSILNIGSGKYLDVSEYGRGSNVVQYNDNGPTNNEKWYVVLDDAGTFLVPYCNVSKALDINNGVIANGTNVQIWDQNLSYAQGLSLIRRSSSGKLSLPTSRTYNDGVYSIRAANNTTYSLGVDNDSNANGVNIQLWQYNADNDYEHWQFTYLGNGLYSICNIGSGRYLDVSEYGHGMNVVQYNDNGPTDNEKWYVVLHDSRTYLVPYCNATKALDIDNGILENGTNIQIWDQNLSYAQSLSLIRRVEKSSRIPLPGTRTFADGVYGICSVIDSSYSLGIDGDSDANGARVQLWYYSRNNDYENWSFKYLGNGLYSIENVGSGKYLDVSEYGKGTDIVQYNYNGPTNNEKWYVIPDSGGAFLVPYCNISTALDIHNGVMANGQYIHLYDQTLGNTQRMLLVPRKLSLLENIKRLVFNIVSSSAEESGSSGDVSTLPGALVMLGGSSGESSSVMLNLMLDNTVLFKDQDYRLDNLVAHDDGTLDVTVTGIGEYCGTISTVLETGTADETVTITFDTNVGSGPFEERIIQKGTVLGILPESVRDGYVLDGWYTDPTNGTLVDENYVVSESITIYAHWTARHYTVNYLGNGATGGTMNSPEYSFGAYATASPNGYSRDGFTFNGWNTRSDGSGTSYKVGDSIQALLTGADEEIMLFAQWTRFEILNLLIDETYELPELYGRIQSVSSNDEEIVVISGKRLTTIACYDTADVIVQYNNCVLEYMVEVENPGTRPKTSYINNVMRLPKSLTQIDTEAFFGDTRLRWGIVFLPKSLKNVMANAFTGAGLGTLVVTSADTHLDDTCLDNYFTTVICPKGSYAASFAERNGYPFIYSVN